MDIHRRTMIKAGAVLGASIFLEPARVLAQSQPLLQKKIPSSGELLPIVGIGTARRYEDVKNDAEKVPLKETIRSFREILDGKHDDLPEAAFYMVGNIDEAVEKARKMKGE